MLLISLYGCQKYERGRAAAVSTIIGRSMAEFRDEWSSKAEEDRKAHRAARLTFPQVVALAGSISMTALLLGGLM